MRLKRRFLALFVLIGILCLFPILITAQDTQPTPIPSEGESEDDSAAPSLEGVVPVATEEVSESEGTTDTTSPINSNEPVCPTLVQESFTATEFVCEDVGTGEACIGNGTVEAIFGAADTGATFSSPGETTRFTSMEELSLRSTSTADGVWTVVSGRIELNSTDGSIPVGVPLLMFGDVTFSDTGQIASGVARNANVIAGNGLNVRRTPGNDGVVVWQLGAGEQVLATGITSDKQWIRMQIPNRFSGIGWVYAPYLEVDGGSDALPFVTINSPEPDLTPPEFGPMQSVELLTANTSPDCDTIDSGVLLQSPSGLPDRVRIRINSMELRLNGTAYIQAQADGLMTVTVLEGEVALIVDGSRTNVTSGSQASVALNSNLEPSGSAQVSSVSLGDFQALPIRLLPRQVILGESGSSSSTAPEPTQSTGFGTPAPTATLETCMLTAPSDISEPRNLRAGPGIDYPVVINLGANQRTTGIGQINVAGFVWYQTSDNAFVRFDAVELSGSCSGLPIVEAPPSPAASPTPVAPTPGLTSSLLGEVACPDGRVSASGTSDGRDVSISLGGTWTVQAGTTITVTTQGGILRPEFGDYIKLIGEDGAVLANSGEGRQVQATFDQTRTFIARFSAANGDLIVMEVVCSGVTG